jgi:hypothetical protein
MLESIFMNSRARVLSGSLPPPRPPSLSRFRKRWKWLAVSCALVLIGIYFSFGISIPWSEAHASGADRHGELQASVRVSRNFSFRTMKKNAPSYRIKEVSIRRGSGEWRSSGPSVDCMAISDYPRFTICDAGLVFQSDENSCCDNLNASLELPSGSATRSCLAVWGCAGDWSEEVSWSR